MREQNYVWIILLYRFDLRLSLAVYYKLYSVFFVYNGISYYDYKTIRIKKNNIKKLLQYYTHLYTDSCLLKLEKVFANSLDDLMFDF